MVTTTSARAAAILAVSTDGAARRLQLLDRSRIEIDALDLMAGLDQVLRHRQTHIAEPDESDPRHDVSFPCHCRLFLRRLQREPQIDHEQRRPPARSNSKPPSNTCGKNSVDRDHRHDRGEPDHRAPRRREPQPDRRDQIDHREKHRRRLPGDRLVSKASLRRDDDAAHLRPVIEPLEHRHRRPSRAGRSRAGGPARRVRSPSFGMDRLERTADRSLSRSGRS